MPQPNDLSRSLVALDQDSTIIAVVEMSQSSWLVAGVLPGIERQPQKKLEPSAERLLGLLHRWRDEAVRAGKKITRIALAFEAGRDGFWLARWLSARGVEAHVIHPSSVAVSREHRRAKTDRLDTELLKRGFLGWLRGERGHCSMVRVPTIAEEDAKRPNRERECLVGERTRIVNRIKSTLARLGIRDFKPTLRKAAERQQHLVRLTPGQVGKAGRRGRALKGEQPVPIDSGKTGKDFRQFFAAHALDRIPPDAFHTAHHAHMAPPLARCPSISSGSLLRHRRRGAIELSRNHAFLRRPTVCEVASLSASVSVSAR